MASKEAHDEVRRMFEHMQQVEAGLIPADSPPDFVRPEDGLGGGPNGDLPWWFPPDYKPTEEALKEFQETPPGAPRSEEMDDHDGGDSGVSK